jgi:hypothetical protein
MSTDAAVPAPPLSSDRTSTLFGRTMALVGLTAGAALAPTLTYNAGADPEARVLASLPRGCSWPDPEPPD